MYNRRRFLGTTAAATLGLFLSRNSQCGETSYPPFRVITKGPRHHWFGYYDKLEFDPTGRYVLSNGVDFEHRSPRADDRIEVGMVDLEDGDRWVSLGESTAWCWQQGCMLQWIPGSRDTVLWNDREDGRYVCRLLNVKTGQKRTIPHPIYALSPSGRTAIATDFRRLGHARPGYGYNGIDDPNLNVPLPEDTGIFHVDLITGAQKLLLSVAEVAKFGPQLPSMQGTAKHWFNHLLFNPDGTRFVFLHRWATANGGRETRMVTAKADGSEMRVIDANGLTSHFIWRDPSHILAFSNHPSAGKRFYLFEDACQGEVVVVGKDEMTNDGHCTYLPGSKWVLNDTYPDANRFQKPFLFEVDSKRVVQLGRFLSPKEYTGEWRCDTHPRFSPDGTKIVIDSPTEGQGRQLHLIDIREIVG
ncbi:MAG: hypothetical protein DWH81_11415 [Planctomycetota bacterium]|nr:MAG: hypothetical protein DWH81_11415 [Planctomycetota bacterium]